MKSILTHKSVSGFSAALSVLLFVILAFVDFRISAAFGRGVIAHQFSFFREPALMILNSWGEAGRKLYLQTVFLDYLFPFSVGVFLASGIIDVLQKQVGKSKNIRQTVFIIMPFVFTLFDWMENAYQIAQVRHLDRLPDWIFFMTSVCSILKWVFLLVSILIWFKLKNGRRSPDHV